MAPADASVHAILVVRPVARDRGYRARDLVEQGADLVTVVNLAACQRCGDDLARVGVHTKVQFPPGPALAGTVLLDQPLAGPTQLPPCAVHQQMHGLGIAPCIGVTRPWPGHLQGGCPAAQGGVVRDRQIEAEQADDGADQPFGLPVRQTEHSAERQSRQDGELGIPGLATPGGARLSPPGCDCLVGEPDRQAPALAQAGVIGRPVRDLAPLSRNVVAGGLVQLEGQGGHPRSEEGRRPTPPRPQHQPPSRSVHHSHERDMAAITAPDYPGERLIVCRNPDLARERARKREDLLCATERDLAGVARAVTRARTPLRSREAIALAAGAVLNRHKVAKHFELTITDDAFRFARNTAAIAAEAALDGFYVVRTNLPAATLDDAGTVRSYKSLAQVERAFRSLKGIDLRIRPLFHWLAPRVRAHVFLCLLAYHVEWHMRRKLAPMLYEDDDRAGGEALRESIVGPAQRSPAARSKQTRGVTPDGLPVHSFRTLLADLATLTRNTVTTALAGAGELTVYARPTPLQTRAFALLGISPERTQ